MTDKKLMDETFEDMRTEFPGVMDSGDMQTAVLAMKKLLERQRGMPLRHAEECDVWFVLRDGKLEMLCSEKDMGDTDWLKLGYEGFAALEEEFGVKFPKNFSYEHYTRDEDKVLKPMLERAGFTEIRFYMGESDSCGPLTRVIRCYDPDGKPRRVVYG